MLILQVELPETMLQQHRLPLLISGVIEEPQILLPGGGFNLFPSALPQEWIVA